MEGWGREIEREKEIKKKEKGKERKKEKKKCREKEKNKIKCKRKFKVARVSGVSLTVLSLSALPPMREKIAVLKGLESF